MKWREFTHNNIIYDLSHIHPFDWSFTEEKTEKRQERTYKFHVTFSSHCFTRKPLRDEEIDPRLWYTWLINSRPEQRLFCFYRYGHSIGLPAIVEELNSRTCWHTSKGNFFTIELKDNDGKEVEYEVYFDVSRSNHRGWLNLVIQSAYVRTEDHASTQPKKKKIRLGVIAYNRQNNKPIKVSRC